MIKELDVVTLSHYFREHGLSKGSRGAVVHCYSDGQAFEVEFDGEGIESHILTLERTDIQLERATIQAQVIELLAGLPEDLLLEVRDFAEFLQQKQAV